MEMEKTVSLPPNGIFPAQYRKAAQCIAQRFARPHKKPNRIGKLYVQKLVRFLQDPKLGGHWYLLEEDYVRIMAFEESQQSYPGGSEKWLKDLEAIKVKRRHFLLNN